MDRGDNGFVLHESFKDLKTRRAEQEAYRRALEEQIMQKRKLQEQEREIYQGRKEEEMAAARTPPRYPPTPPAFQTPRNIQPPEAFSTPISKNVSLSSSQSYTPTYEHTTPASKDRLFSLNESSRYIDLHPEVTLTHMNEKSAEYTSSSTGIPQFSPECMKYLQQVIPGFKLPQPQSIPKDFNDSMSMSMCQNMTHNAEKSVNQTPQSNEFLEIQHNRTNEYTNHHDHPDAAFSSSGTSSESSSTEDVSTHGKNRVHVSQTSEQMEGVKVSRKQYREELQKQINERKRRDEEQRRKAQEEEAKIQEKIRIEQEKMQREYEEELRKQEEREREAEQKRLASLEKQKEIIRAKEEAKAKSRSSKMKIAAQKDTDDNSSVNASTSASEESIQSIGDFFDDTMMPKDTKFVNPDDRIIPVVAKQLREKSFLKEKPEQPGTTNVNHENSMLTARIDSVLMDSSLEAPPPYKSEKGLVREMAIRSAPCPSTLNSTDLEFLASLKTYLQGEKSKIDERVHARASKSTEGF